jgi:hypothetical protein
MTYCITLEDDDDIEECKAAVSGADNAACQETQESLCAAAAAD